MSVVRRAAACLVLAAALAGCTSDDQPPPAAPTPSITALADLAGADVTAVRAGFCPRVAPGAVEDALGAPADDSATWSNGDRAEVVAGTRDVVHEYGCSWTSADGAEARAWVFAPPVTPGRARKLADQARQADGCRPVEGAAAFGAPSAAVTCDAGGRSATAYAGLFGDAWLSCSLESAAAPDPAAVDAWCAAVAQAASA